MGPNGLKLVLRPQTPRPRYFIRLAETFWIQLVILNTNNVFFVKIGARVLDLLPDNSFGPQTSNVKVLGSKTFSLWNNIKTCPYFQNLGHFLQSYDFYYRKIIKKNPSKILFLVPIQIYEFQKSTKIQMYLSGSAWPNLRNKPILKFSH